ncbi:MAG: chemotaxis protein CheW [Actinomycetota bacterium]
MSPQLYATFTVHDRYLGVPVERVQEVLRAQAITPVPLAHPHIEGLLNMRGQIVTALDLRARLDLPAREAGAPTANVIVMTPEGPLSLLVDALGDVVTVSEELFEPPPETLQTDTGHLIKGAYKLDDALLLDLDLDRTLDFTSARGT